MQIYICNMVLEFALKYRNANKCICKSGLRKK